MRQIPNPLREAETLQYRPARWVQTIATDFFSREPLPLEKERAQTSQGTKRCTARSGGTATHDRHVKCLHWSIGVMTNESHSNHYSTTPIRHHSNCRITAGARFNSGAN